MKKLRNLLLGVILAFTFVSNTMCVNYIKADEETQNLSNYLKKDESKIWIGETQLTESDSTVNYSEKFRILFSWGFTDNAYPTSTSDKMTYTLPTGMNISEQQGELKDGSTAVGHYYIKDNTITIAYDITDGDASTNFLSKSARVGTLDVLGTLDLSITNNGKGGETTFNFPGIGEYKVNIEEDSSKTGLEIQKTAGKVNEETMTAEYTLKITSVGKNTNVKVEDTMGANLTLKGDVAFYTDENCTTAYTGTVSTEKNSDNKGFASTIASMDMNEVLYAKYTVSIDKKAYAYDKDDAINKNKAEISSTEEPGTYYKPNSEVGINWSNVSWVSKTGEIDSKDGNVINWTITVNKDNKDVDLKGTTLKDTMSYSDNSNSTYVENSLKVKGADGKEVTLSGLTYGALIGNGYTFPDGSKGKYVITYSTKVTQADSLNKTKVTNKATVNPWGDTKDHTDSKDITIGDDHQWIKKECNTTVNSDEVVWTITVNAGADTSNLIVKDEIPNGMEYVDNSLSITSGYTGTPTTGKEGSKLNITFGQVSKGTTIVFTLKTKITDDLSNVTSKKYTNKVRCYDGETQKGEKADAEYEYKNTQYLSKDYTYQNLYKLTVSKLPEYATTVTITDVLPENMKLKAGSVLVTQHDWEPTVEKYHLSGLEVSETTDETTGIRTLTFTISGDALAYAKSNGYLYVFYDVDYVDITKALKEHAEKNNDGWKEYKNTAHITVDELTCPDVSKKQSFQLKDSTIVNKSAKYDETTAPNIDYTITVNEKALDLVSGDTITLTDTLGTGIEYYMGSMKFNGEKATGDQVVYDKDTNTLTIKVPDSQKVVITYSATITLNIDEELNSDNSSNNVTLALGSDSDKISSTTVQFGKVLKSKGTSTGEGVSAEIYKYDSEDQTNALSGATFALYSVNYKDGEVTSAALINNYTTSSNGRTGLGSLVRNQLYKLVETKAPEGYVVDSTPKYFMFKDSGKGNDEVTYPETIDGVKVDLIDANKSSYTYSIANTKQSEEKGNLVITKAVSGVENSSVEDVVKFTVVDPSGASTEYTLGNDNFTYNETDKVWKLELSNIAIGEYKITETASDVTGKNVSVSYVVDTKESVEGKEATTTVTNGGTTTVAFTNTYTEPEKEKTTVTISKVAVTGGEELVGATLKVTKDTAEGDLVESWTSTSTVKTLSLEEGTYVLTETIAPTGYSIATSITFKVTSDGKVTDANGTEVSDKKIEMVDELKAHEVTISKVDMANSKELPGATLTITDENGNTIKDSNGNNLTWTSTTSEQKVSLKAGTYVLKEDAAPAGYNVASSITFTVNMDGTVKVGDNTVDKVVMKDEATKYEVEISKVDATSKEELPGASLKIAKDTKDGEEVTSWKSTSETKKVYLTAGTYVLTEITAPEGYEIAESITFVVGTNGKIANTDSNKVTMEDAHSKGTLVITKTIEGDVTKEEAEGTIEFIVTDSNKKETTYTLKENGVYENGVWTITINDVVVGEYTVEEVITDEISGRIFKCYTVKVNDGDEQYDDPTVNVTANNTTIVAYKNTYERYHYILEKHDLNDTDKVLTGATYKLQKYDDEKGSYLDLYDANGKIVDFTTGVNGQVTISDEGFEGFRLTEGTYRLVETGAPTGYDLGESKVFTISGTAVLMMLDDEEAEQRPMIGATLRVYDAKLTEKPKEEPKKEEPKEDKVYSEEKHEYVYRVVNTSSK